MEGLGTLKLRKAGSSAAARIILLLRTIKMNTIPVIHCISNIVTANDCANLLLAAGFSPVMAEEPLEMEEFASAADALVINLGTPSEPWRSPRPAPFPPRHFCTACRPAPSRRLEAPASVACAMSGPCRPFKPGHFFGMERGLERQPKAKKNGTHPSQVSA